MSNDAEKLRGKLDEWKSWMRHDDDHSIYSQIYQMLWEDAVFRMVNECWRICPAGDDGSIRFNSQIHGLIVGNFFQTQAIYIRRLVENNDEKKPNRSVVSLKRLLDEIETAQKESLLRRGAFLEAHGLPRDPRGFSAKSREENSEERISAIVAESQARHVHECFDLWCGVIEETRSDDDSIPLEVVETIKSNLRVCEDIKRFVDKNVAHAAHQSNRLKIPPEAQTICLGKIWECHKSICEVASTVCSLILLEDFPDPVPVCLFDQFEHLDQPWVQSDQVQSIRDEWDKHRNEIQGWFQTTLCSPGASDIA